MKINYLSLTLTGYTLLEALIAIAIIGILSAVALPSLKEMLDHNHDVVLQATLLRSIETARQEAFIRNKPVSICKGKDDRLFIFLDEEQDGVIRDKKQMIAIEQLNMHHGQIYWRAYPFYRHYLHFMPFDLTNSDNGMFWYCHSRQAIPAFAIAINKSGSTRIIYPDNNSQIKDSRGKILTCSFTNIH